MAEGDKGPDERAPNPPNSLFRDPASWERALGPFLSAPTEEAADRKLDFLVREFISPTVISTLSFELRRGPKDSLYRIWASDESFREIQAAVESRLVQRLRRLRTELLRGEPGVSRIADVRGYVCAAARNGFFDYLRERHPGRHSLDTALRAALGTASDLALWHQQIRTDYHEWRCGLVEWKAQGKTTISIRGDRMLQARLWGELREGNRTRAEALRHIFHLLQAPVLYADILDFLAALWNVEAPYRAAALGSSPLRIEGLAVSAQDPADIVNRLGTLQELWKLLQPLSHQQKAVLMLRLPVVDGRNFLEEFSRFGIVNEARLAEDIGITATDLRFQYPMLPLEDIEIAALLKVPVDDVRRIRQDARRRLRRLRHS